MSDAPQGPGWWQASDGRWYPPEQAPPAPATYWYGQGAVGAAAARSDGLAVTAFVFALVGIPVGFVCGLGFLLPVAAIPMGVVARGRIRRSNGALSGEGMALAAIIIGSIVTALVVIGVIVLIALFASLGESSTY